MSEVLEDQRNRKCRKICRRYRRFGEIGDVEKCGRSIRGRKIMETLEIGDVVRIVEDSSLLPNAQYH